MPPGNPRAARATAKSAGRPADEEALPLSESLVRAAASLPQGQDHLLLTLASSDYRHSRDEVAQAAFLRLLQPLVQWGTSDASMVIADFKQALCNLQRGDEVGRLVETGLHITSEDFQDRGPLGVMDASRCRHPAVNGDSAYHAYRALDWEGALAEMAAAEMPETDPSALPQATLAFHACLHELQEGGTLSLSRYFRFFVPYMAAKPFALCPLDGALVIATEDHGIAMHRGGTTLADLPYREEITAFCRDAVLHPECFSSPVCALNPREPVAQARDPKAAEALLSFLHMNLERLQDELDMAISGLIALPGRSPAEATTARPELHLDPALSRAFEACGVATPRGAADLVRLAGKTLFADTVEIIQKYSVLSASFTYVSTREGVEAFCAHVAGQVDAYYGVEPAAADPQGSADLWSRPFVPLSQFGKSAPYAIGVDVEHHAERNYLGISCLLQISLPDGSNWIFDTLELTGAMHLLRPLFADPRVIKVMHGAKEDVIWLQRDFRLYIVGLFDTYHAACVLERPRSLKKLLEDVLGLRLSKAEQQSDWSLRPLTSSQLFYAQNDTHWLLPLYDRLVEALRRKDEAGAAAGETAVDASAPAPTSALARVWNESARVALREFGRAFLHAIYAGLRVEPHEPIDIPVMEAPPGEAHQAGLLTLRYPPATACTESAFAMHLLLLWREFLAASLNESPWFVFRPAAATRLGELCSQRGEARADISEAAVYQVIRSRGDLQTPLLLHHLGEVPLILKTACSLYLKARDRNELPLQCQTAAPPLRDGVGFFSSRAAGERRDRRQARALRPRGPAGGIEEEICGLISELGWGGIAGAGAGAGASAGFSGGANLGTTTSTSAAISLGSGTRSDGSPGRFTPLEAADLRSESELAVQMQYGVPGHAALLLDPANPVEPERREQPLTEILQEHDSPAVVRVLPRGEAPSGTANGGNPSAPIQTFW